MKILQFLKVLWHCFVKTCLTREDHSICHVNIVDKSNKISTKFFCLCGYNAGITREDKK